MVAGIPSDKTQAGPGGDGFNVASYTGSGGIQNSYGSTLTGHVGFVGYDPSAQHPDLEFTINGFNSIAGLNPTQGFWIKVYAGSPTDGVVGEENSQWIHVPAFAPEIGVPEPTTWLAWTLIGGGLACWRRYRSR